MNGFSAEPDPADVVVSASPFAELVAPPAMRHQPETATAVIADLALLGASDSHDILLRIPQDSLVAVSRAGVMSSE